VLLFLKHKLPLIHFYL